MKTITATGVCIATALTLGACATNPEFPNFGDSVRTMVQQQIANPDTISNPSEEPVEGFPGTRGEQVVSEHDNNVARPEDTSNVINVSIGGN